MFKRILVPLDGSSLAEQALPRAGALARAARARLDLVLVHERLALPGFQNDSWDSQRRNAERGYLEAIAGDLADEHSIDATWEVVDGAPAETICRKAEETGADLIAMTSHGRTGWSRIWLGSVAHEVLRQSGVPVLLLRPTERSPRAGAPRELFSHVLVPVDDTTRAASVIPMAMALARAGSGRVTLLRVVHPVPLVIPDGNMSVIVPAIVPDEGATRRLVDAVRAELCELADRMKGDGCIATHVAAAERPAQAILDWAASQEVDAIAMATRARSGAARVFLGSVADKVVRASDVPVLLYRPDVHTDSNRSVI